MKAKIFFAALLLFAAGLIAGTGRAGFAFLSAALALVAVVDPHSLKEFGPWKFWLSLVLFVLLTPLFAGERDLQFVGWAYSSAQLRVGLGLLCNAYVFMVLVAFVSGNFSLDEIVALAERYFGKNAGLRLALVSASASMMKRALGETWLLYSAGRGRLRQFYELPVFMAAALRNTAVRAEQIAALFFIRNTGV